MYHRAGRPGRRARAALLAGGASAQLQLTAPTGLDSRLIAACARQASWLPVSGATYYVVRDTVGTEQTTTSPVSYVSCPWGSPESNKPKWVKACDAVTCSSRSYF
ncbi:uncharacterized protein SOCE26_100390 [Sorangium cellulosum]|uniref:Secreted protein n=1 Tax=Sorangium cellulosum TaxID=56 RepID=A0A2L0FAG0_SORCE|nr:uncharacterized protein SOCE26_100390 [Sorangium cellulosum]